jgi:hypothetical protein
MSSVPRMWLDDGDDAGRAPPAADHGPALDAWGQEWWPPGVWVRPTLSSPYRHPM